MSEQRAISIDDLVALNDHWQRRAVKAEAELAYALNQLVNARRDALIECADIALKYDDCGGQLIADKIRALPDDLSAADTSKTS